MQTRLAGWICGCALGFLCITSARAQVIITEIMFHPGLGRPGEPGYIPEDRAREFIEVLNTHSQGVNLGGWKLDKGVSFAFPAVTLLPGQYLVVAADSDVGRFKAVYAGLYPNVNTANIVGGWTGTLSDNGEAIELVDASGKRVDAVSYATQGDWARRREGQPYPGHESWWRGWEWENGADGGGKSLESVNPALSNDYGQNWLSSRSDGGTPGGPNSVANPGTAPLIVAVRHRPAIPKSTDAVIVLARIVPTPVPGTPVMLFHRVDGNAAFGSAAMSDDGAHGDGAAGDGTYAAVLPPRPDRTVTEFYVQAGLPGRMRTWPGPSDDAGNQDANAVFQVDDSIDAGPQPIYRLIFTQREYEAWNGLVESSSGAYFSDAAMHGTFIGTDGLGTEIRYRVSVRNRGAGTRTAHPHNLHVSFPDDAPWRGMTSLGLNTRTVHAQVAGNAFHSLAGLPNAYGAPVQVRVNGANLANPVPTGSTDSYQFGSYYAFQPYGKEWAEGRLPGDSDGNVYKAVWYFDGVKLDNNGGDLRYLGEDPASYRQAYSTNGPSASSGAYSKHTNVAEDDWSDLIGLVRTLSTAPEATYLDDVSRAVNIDEWLRYFAVSTLVGNMETTLATGVGDDYSLFAGKIDPRFQVLPHDLDTCLGEGDANPDVNRSIWRAANLPALDRFLRHPEIARRYYSVLRELTETVFSQEQANATLDQWLGGWVPSSVIDRMKDFVARRRAGVLAQIPAALTATVALPLDTYYRTTASATSLTGNAPATETRSVRVNGAPATWTAWTGSWSADAVPLNPGVNRVVVQSLGSDGAELERSTIDIWYDTGRATIIPGGTLGANTDWRAVDGPFRVTGTVVIPANITLRIEPGTTLFFDSGAGLTVAGGRLVAEGTAFNRIRFTRRPGTSEHWSGLQFLGSAQLESSIAYADVEFADAQAQVISVDGAQVRIDHITMAHNDTKTFALVAPRVVIRNSAFADVGAHELLKAERAVTDGWLVLESNLFGGTTGPHDVLRLDQMGVCAIRDNVFLGSENHILRLNATDAHVEGNLFMHARSGSPEPLAQAAIWSGSLGGAASPSQPHLWLVRNVFFENQYAVIEGAGVFAELYNNVLAANSGGVLFDELENGSGPGRGAYVENTIFWGTNTSGAFVNLTNRASDGHSQLAIQNSLVPSAFRRYGNGNIEGDPRFRRPDTQAELTADAARFGAGFEGFAASEGLVSSGALPDLRLQAGSPAIAAGLNGVDLGYNVPAGASLAGVPESQTAAAAADIRVAGTDSYGYRYRVIGPGAVTNDWSAELAAVRGVSGITRAGGIATARVTAHGYAPGNRVQVWGAEHEAYNGLFAIVGVTADTFSYSVAGTPPDEPSINDIRCRKPETIALRGLAPGSYTLQVIGKSALGIWQSMDAPSTASWTVQSGTGTRVRLNELLASNISALPNATGAFPDAVELFNPGPIAADLSGMGLSKSESGSRFVFPTGTALGPGEYLVVWGDAGAAGPGLHLGYGLDRQGDALLLWDKEAGGGALLDAIRFGPQLPDYSIGRGATGEWALTIPTLGGPNKTVTLGNPARLRINEWLGAGRSLAVPEFIELFNPEPAPVSLAGLSLRPEPTPLAGGQPIPPLSFIAPGGFAILYPDGHPDSGASHLDFTLSSNLGAIGLFAPDDSSIDVILHGPQAADVSEGRLPDGGPALGQLLEPTPGGGNSGMRWARTNVVEERLVRVPFDAPWRFNQAGVDLGTSWRATDFDDSAWPAGSALFFAGDNDYPVPQGSPLSLTSPAGPPTVTYYFRAHFPGGTNLPGATLQARLVVDDGAVVYLNGEPLLTVGMPSGQVDYATRPDRTVGSPDIEGPFPIPMDRLLAGDNVLAAEVHQVSDRSHDIAFALELASVVAKTNVINDPSRPVHLNEFMARSATANGGAGARADWVELANTSEQPVNLAGFSLTDAPDQPRKWVFPPSSVLAPHGLIVVACDSQAPASTSNTGFGLNASGGVIGLYAPPAQGSALVDAVYYGLQVAGLTVGRDDRGAWNLCEPTPELRNIPVDLGEPAAIRINEWMASPVAGSDWFELVNSGNRPVVLSGLYLNDDLLEPGVDPIPALSFLGTGEGAYQVFWADGDPISGADHAGFKLSASGESIGLFAADGTLLDGVAFGAQIEGVSQGSFPDGSATLTSFPGNPTPGGPNGTGTLRVSTAEMTGDGFTLTFLAAPQQSYSVLASDSIGPATWRKVTDIPPRSSGGPAVVVDPAASSFGARYYRIVSPAAP